MMNREGWFGCLIELDRVVCLVVTAEVCGVEEFGVFNRLSESIGVILYGQHFWNGEFR